MEIWPICWWIHILAWIYRRCIVFHKALVWGGSLQYLQCVPYAAILQIFYWLAWFDAVEFNRLPCPNDKKYDDVVFVYRFRYQLTMFGIRVLIWISRLLHSHIAYNMDTAKMIAEFCRISYCLHDSIRLNSIVWNVHTKSYSITWLSLIDSDVNWLCLKCVDW